MKFKLIEAAESKICCICKKPFDGYGNNAEPVCSGTCCDECNMKEVIPARMKILDKSSSEDINEAVLNETDESGNDEMDANCDDCGAVITIPVDHEGPAYCANCMKNHLHEDLEDYKITYYLSTAERRPETIEDVENDWKEETFTADSDYDACKYAFSIIHDIAEEDLDEYLDDYDIKDVREFVEYCEEKDLGDGSTFIVKLEGPNGVIYDMGQTKDDFIEQVKENDDMLNYYRSVLGIDESLNEGNLDILNTEKDNNKMNEDMSVRAKLKALYPELNFDDEVTEGFDDDMDFDLEESSEHNFMEALYKGADFDAHDDESLEESSDCEDDECWENDIISEDFDDDAEWWDDTLDDETGDFIYQAAEELGLEDFWFEDGGYAGAHTSTEFGYTKDGINYKAECDYEDTDVNSVEEAVDLLKGLDWSVS